MYITKINRQEVFCSVVMPVHNGERYLREAIESVLNQTYTNFEFLIIENCSTDNSVKIIKSYDDPRIRLIIEKDCGQVQAYNRGFREAKGEYIFIHDQDDVSDLVRFEKQLEYITNNNLDILGSYYNLIDSKGRKLTEVTPPIQNDEIKKVYYYKVTYLYNPTLCIRREVFNRFGYFYKHFFPSSDFEFILRIIHKVKVGNIPLFLLNWRNHKSSLSHSNIRTGFKNALIIANDYLDLNKNYFNKEDFIFIKANIFYYYNNLLKALKIIILNFNLRNFKLTKLFVKIVIFFIPIKILRLDDYFNARFILLLRKIMKL
jgi:glycosyltransferase involved in cell wall biosynthesis